MRLLGLLIVLMVSGCGRYDHKDDDEKTVCQTVCQADGLEDSCPAGNVMTDAKNPVCQSQLANKCPSSGQHLVFCTRVVKNNEGGGDSGGCPGGVCPPPEEHGG